MICYLWVMLHISNWKSSKPFGNTSLKPFTLQVLTRKSSAYINILNMPHNHISKMILCHIFYTFIFLYMYFILGNLFFYRFSQFQFLFFNGWLRNLTVAWKFTLISFGFPGGSDWSQRRKMGYWKNVLKFVVIGS